MADLAARASAGTSPADGPTQTVFHVVMSVWGDAYIDLFTAVAVPNQMSSGNLGSLPTGSRYRIFTRAEDVEKLDRAVSALRSTLPVELIVMDRDESDENKYEEMIRYNRRAVADALQEGAALIFLAPDHLLATHTLSRVVELRARGYRAVMCTGVRLSKEPMLASLSSHGTTELPARTLVRMALPHLHPFTLEHMADAEPFSRFPTFVYWRVGDSGLLARCLHLHSLMLDPMKWKLPKTAPDGEYLSRAVPDPSAIYVVRDSDELVVFELTTQDAVSRGRRSWPKTWRMAAIAFRSDAHQTAFLQQSICLHCTDVDAPWARAEEESARFIGAVLRRRRAARLLFPAMNRLRSWQQRYDRRLREIRRKLPRLRMKRIKRPVLIAAHDLRRRLKRAVKTRRRR